MLQINSNGSKWYGEQPASIDDLIAALERHPLDPRFERNGNFIYKPFHPKSEDGNLVDDLDRPLHPDHPGALSFFGNFYGVSHVFNITTDQPEIIEQLTAAIRANQATPAYQQAQQETPQ